MNILFISNNAPNKDTGLYWSIPNQVMAQKKYDNVLWYNEYPSSQEYWEKTGVYHSSLDFPSRKIADFPAPFNHPDLVVFEGFYWPVYKLYFQVKRLGIPYVIVPRGSLTKEGQRIHPWKKRLGNLFFKRFTRNALAVHYLTQAEYNDSGDGWNRKHVILSNGVVENSDKQWKAKTYPKKREGLKGVFIGRISMFHKGLDLLVEACKTIQEELRKAHLTIDIYGPDRQLHREILMKSITDAHVEDILLVHTKPIFGEEKERIMLDSDFFVLTSRLEGHPMGLIEALSYGMPSLVTRGSNMMDEIAKADAGWCSENTTEGIATSFKQLLKDVERLADKSEKAVELAQMYNWDSIAQRTHTEYSKLLKG